MSVGGPSGIPPAPPPLPADVGIVAALPIEIGPLRERLKDVRKYRAGRHLVVEGQLAGKLVAMVVAGPGREAARRGAELLVAGHRPRWVVSAGFGGALDPALARNDIVLAREVVDPEGRRLAIDVRLPTDSGGPRKLVAGRLATVDRIVRTAAEKAALRAATGADVVDMETSAVAAVCASRGLRFLSVRVVSDEASTDLPKEIMTILGRSGGYRVGAAFGAIWRRPSSVVDLLTLREHALEAADRLAAVLPGFLEQLPD